MKKFCIALGALALSCSAFAVYEVHLDWLGSEAEFDKSWTAAGYGAGMEMTASDYAFIHHTVEATLEGIFAPFSIGFGITPPAGAHEKIFFGAATTSGAFGVADAIDWRNKMSSNTATVFSGNFGGMMSAGMFDRATNLSRFATSLAGTAAHELLHNHGLQHYDAFGWPDISVSDGYAGVAGQQNDSIMATGSTGLTLERRTMPRVLNPLEMIKLEFGMGVTPTPGVTVMEDGGSNGSFATAQFVLGHTLAIAGGTAVNVDGSLSSSGDEDIYKFHASLGSLITANTFSALTEGDSVDTLITLYNDMGDVIFTNDNISYTTGSFGGVGFYSTDSIIMNYAADYTGYYYLEVESAGGSGDYELLLAGIDTVPEPATMFGLASLGLLAFRRRKI
ncbi:MAG: PEP-CTERM sorting domain-containing protein [Fimbriimonadaceae bacterium]